MNSKVPTVFEQRLRLIIAREFAARGYYLDVEGMYEGTITEALSPEELELLAKVAALSGDWGRAERRFTLLAESGITGNLQSRAFEMVAYARGQSERPKAEPHSKSGSVRIEIVILLSFLAGAAVTVLILLAAGMNPFA